MYVAYGSLIARGMYRRVAPPAVPVWVYRRRTVRSGGRQPQSGGRDAGKAAVHRQRVVGGAHCSHPACTAGAGGSAVGSEVHRDVLGRVANRVAKQCTSEWAYQPHLPALGSSGSPRDDWSRPTTSRGKLERVARVFGGCCFRVLLPRAVD